MGMEKLENTRIMNKEINMNEGKGDEMPSDHCDEQ
jgi:hypothetical protein